MMRERIAMIPWRKPQIESKRPSTVLKESGLPIGTA